MREREERRRTKSGFTVLQQWRSVIYIGKLIDFGNCLFVCVCVCVVGLENEMMMSMTRDGLCHYNIYLLYIYLQSWLLPLPI